MIAHQTSKKSVIQWPWAPVILLLVVVLTPAVLAWLVFCFLFRLALLLTVWFVWSTRGISMLTIYSNSPHWQRYFEDGVLPLVEQQSKVLNWSERSTWPISFKTIVFSVFQGDEEFNPTIIFFRPLRWQKELRFYQAFRDAKHGKTKPLRKLEQELSVLINKPIDLDHLHPRESA